MYGELHMHVFMNGYDYKKAVADNSASVDTEHIREVFSAYHKAGITFLRDGGDNLNVSDIARNYAQEYGINYITPIFALHKKGLYGSVVGKAWRDMGEFRGYVDEVKARGGDFIKIMTTGILDFNEYGKVSEGALEYKELKEAVNIAHGEGFKVMAHTNGAENIINAVNAGVDSIEHGYYASKESLDMLIETKTVWVPTAVTSSNLLKTSRYPKDTVRRISRDHLANVTYALGGGANVGLGSDAGAYAVAHGDATIEEYETLACAADDITKLNDSIVRSEEIVKGWKRV